MVNIVATIKNWVITKESHFLESLDADLHLLIGKVEQVEESVAAKLLTLEGVEVAEAEAVKADVVAEVAKIEPATVAAPEPAPVTAGPASAVTPPTATN
jgi:hypothetical protein